MRNVCVIVNLSLTNIQVVNNKTEIRIDNIKADDLGFANEDFLTGEYVIAIYNH